MMNYLECRKIVQRLGIKSKREYDRRLKDISITEMKYHFSVVDSKTGIEFPVVKIK